MLTTPDNLLFLHLLNDDTQNELVYHLSRDGGEADWPVIPWQHMRLICLKSPFKIIDNILFTAFYNTFCSAYFLNDVIKLRRDKSPICNSSGKIFLVRDHDSLAIAGFSDLGAQYFLFS